MKKGIVGFIGLVLVGSSHSEVKASETGQPQGCNAPQSSRKVLECVLGHHPDLTRTRMERNQASAQLGLARQIPNPELDSRFGLGTLGGEGGSRTIELALLHTWELGGKRGARVSRADSEVRQAEAELRKQEETAALNALLALHRLRQLEEESETLAETVLTFEKQLKLLRSRPALTPEQQVSHSVFELAKEDAELKEASLLAEKDRLIQTLQLWMGSPAGYSKAWLPKEPTDWPELSASRSVRTEPSGLRKAAADLSLAQAELDLAGAEAWPDLKLGPFLESAEETSGSAYSLGVQLSLSLPLYHQNSGGKAVARAGIDRAETAANLTRSGLEAERAIALGQYKRVVEKLSKSRWHQESEKRHEKVEHLFQRGVVSISLVIEAHRQVLELQKTSHELEMKALESLYLIQTLDGNLPEAFL